MSRKFLSNSLTSIFQIGGGSSTNVKGIRQVGQIDSGILAHFSDVKVNDLVKKLKEKDFPEVRKWIVNNLDNDYNLLLRRIYDACYETLVPGSVPAAVLVLAKYQYQGAFVADQEINMLACLTEIMVECEFK